MRPSASTIIAIAAIIISIVSFNSMPKEPRSEGEIATAYVCGVYDGQQSFMDKIAAAQTDNPFDFCRKFKAIAESMTKTALKSHD